MNAEAYNLRCVLLIAGRPSGFDRTAEARVDAAADRSAARWCCWLTSDELAGGRPWPVRGTGLIPRSLAPVAEPDSARIGERPAWTDPPGL